MKSIVQIINSYFWKSLIGPIIVFGFSVLWVGMTLLMWNILGVIIPTLILPASFLTFVFIICIVVIPISINDLKKSIVFKKLGSSTIKPWSFMLILLSYYYVICLIGFFYQMPWCYLFMHNNIALINDFFNGAHWIEVFYIFSLSFLMCSTLGITLSSALKQNYQIIIFAVILITLSIPLAGLAAPISLVHNAPSDQYHPNLPSLSKIVYIDPLWYLTSGANEIWFKYNSTVNIYNSDYFNITTSYYSRSISVSAWPIEVLSKPDKIANIFVPIALFTLFNYINIRTFKWSNR